MPMFAGKAQAHTLASQRAGDEYRLAVDMRYATAVVRKISDIGFQNSHARRRPPAVMHGICSK
jgi:predicted fused transcriptional regulator/phosphomethylpyrimidine kinase